ncbi:hypothetical protein BDA96_01G502300 [Sorghum bicolor]|uniref:Uncharacterized protein n=2 Tax=Sorghum bicolor TaxID=4558 RepID=A0A921V2J0_SORBI|nr:hypothetical protein BDA96_01G502300 [Sorghum bicolor]OQU93074.1 hypothetical protein SORBI_3001G471150 [Sorghum bicolor]
MLRTIILMQELLQEDFFTPYDEVCESFDDMAIQENPFRGIYTYGNNTNTGAAATTPVALEKEKKKRKRKRRGRKARSTPTIVQPNRNNKNSHFAFGRRSVG